MKKVLSVLAFIVIAYCGFHLYINYQVSKELDKFVSQASFFVNVSYDDVSANPLKSKLKISDIRISSRNSSEEVKIGEIEINGINFFKFKNRQFGDFSLDLNSNKAKGIAVKDVELDANSSFLKLALKNQAQQNQIFFNMPTPTSFADLGYDTFTFDISMTMQPNPDAQTVEFNLEQSHDDMFNIKFFMVFSTEGEDEWNAYNMQQAKLKEAYIRYEDKSLLDRMYSYQARLTKQDVETLKALAVEEMYANLQTSEIDLSPQDMQSLENFVKYHQPIRLSIKPYKPLDRAGVNTLKLYKTSDLPRILNLQITNE